MAQPLLGFLAFALGTVVVLTVPVLVIWVLVQILKGLGALLGGGIQLVSGLVRHVARFAISEVRDVTQFAGSLLTLCLILPLCLASFGLLRWKAGKHYAGAVEDEFTGALASLYRIGLGNPVRLLGLGALTDGIERRLPDVVDREPRTGRFSVANAPFPRRGQKPAAPAFEGYQIQEELQAGGSGARLFCAIPTDARAKELERRGLSVPQRVVIKAFDLGYGSTIPQIVRESRSLEAAKNLGLILEHELGDGSFHYVMPFVPGEDLDQVTRRMHAMSGPNGLSDPDFKKVIAYSRDLCDQLGRFHREGLWHKDVKPSNLLVAGGRLQVVDFGLVTPLESALTLTTHGTEFFRDPELVRLALAGKRVKDVDGVKFDLYSAGAVLYSMIENSFPAHGSLSSISKRTPEALRWIVRRAMADVDKRYPSAAAMARDIDVLVLAEDPFTVRPADLPSVHGRSEPSAERASFTPPPSGQSSGAASHGSRDADEDIQRINAFGMTAEIRGLGRMKESLASVAHHHSPAGRRARRAAAAEERRVQAEAARDARLEAKKNLRSQRRGMLRVVATLAVFGGIAGGIASIDEQNVHGMPVGATMNDSAEMQRPGSLDEALRFLDQDDTEARYREAAERSLPSTETSSLRPFAPARRLPPSTETELSNLGSMARVLILTDSTDPSLDTEMRSTVRRFRELGAIPLGIDSKGRTTTSDQLDAILTRARRQIELANGSIEETEARLASLAASGNEIDAVYWVRRQPGTGYLRSSLATRKEACGNASWDHHDESCSGASCSDGSNDPACTASTSGGGACGATAAAAVRVSH
ncbi:Serine/threonine-protein kinase PrkC [Planctomycetes bacterium Poly30]|uniref:Serine/threonine-protein kinase PrkC n=1 Tax=Saltatorellus ferox TaxID=2528018 RepID=A0A518ESG6_9BACT|nr:Serine/threonine-protein kinase PrkC [Planctomycetes bacterium Poly30]